MAAQTTQLDLIENVLDLGPCGTHTRRRLSDDKLQRLHTGMIQSRIPHQVRQSETRNKACQIGPNKMNILPGDATPAVQGRG
jgi:hypothetical protein